MQAAGTRQPRLIGYIQQISVAFQQFFGIFLGEKLEKPLGTDTNPTAEEALKMEFAQADVGGDLF